MTLTYLKCIVLRGAKRTLKALTNVNWTLNPSSTTFYFMIFDGYMLETKNMPSFDL